MTDRLVVVAGDGGRMEAQEPPATITANRPGGMATVSEVPMRVHLTTEGPHHVAAVPSEYQGTRFDSRLESRWAAFFDGHDVEWEYHPETFTIAGVYYEPDFWLPESRTIFEVKGAFTSSRDYKALVFAYEAASNDTLIVVGQSPAGERFSLAHPSPQEVFVLGASGGGRLDSDVFFGRCSYCGCWQYVESSMEWRCRCCGYYTGAGTFSEYIYPAGG